MKRDTLKRRFVSRERLPGMEATTTSFHPNSEDEYAQDKQKILDIIVANEEFTHFLFELVFGSASQRGVKGTASSKTVSKRLRNACRSLE